VTTATHARTRAIIEAYHQAWTGPDVASVRQYIAEDFMTRAPVGSYDTREEYLAGLANFRDSFVTRVDMIAEFYGDDDAMLLYDVRTNTPAGSIRTAEYFKLSGDKIASTTLVFDATAWRAMMAQQGKTVDAEGHVVGM
jgi:hypothetical protein